MCYTQNTVYKFYNFQIEIIYIGYVVIVSILKQSTKPPYSLHTVLSRTTTLGLGTPRELRNKRLELGNTLPRIY